MSTQGGAFVPGDDFAPTGLWAFTQAPTIGSGTAVSTSATQTLTNKTLTAPTITTPTVTSPVITGATIPSLIPITTDAADAAVALVSGIVVFTKAGSSAHTLAAPASLGQRIVLTAGSAQAHVVTATGLIDDGVTGGSKTTITLASFIGATCTLIAVQTGKWMVESKNTCVIT
jgi:hypothetical protein